MNFSIMTEQELWAEFRHIHNDLINDVAGMLALSEDYVAGRYLIAEGLKMMTQAHNRRVNEKKTEDIEPQLGIREIYTDEEVQYCNFLSSNRRYMELSNALVNIAKEDYGTADTLIVRGATDIQTTYSKRAINGMLRLMPIQKVLDRDDQLTFEERKEAKKAEEIPEIQDVDEEVVESAVLVDADAETVEADNDADAVENSDSDTVEEAVEKKDPFAAVRLTARNWKDIEEDDSDDDSEKSLDDLLKS